ncbi:hypothetical protein DND132_1941 [Pseudodesulfovibrio mercurii]|uniref:Uncharacterized protein n=1 Tax=Pseudodesulfovibrio mercurii TaxID=641491 RepID=F0JGV7_9BACT|nr:hypothetical protein [Pseudodesulfovibrio mercurii]EGB15147.1 hypothetical protein DND132_1941 [Pseudodesulfovibrio mercurii]
MKSVAQTLSVKTVLYAFLVLFAAGPLSGCAVVAPLLSVGGVAFTPLQYVSTAYTIGEYTYEYAANDKTPDQVLEAKYNAMVSGEAFELPDYLQAEPAGPQPVQVAEAATPESPADQDPGLSEQARRKRIENLLGQRRTRFERLELRRMAFLQATQPRRQTLTLNQPPRTAGLDLVQATSPHVSLD